VSEKKKVLSIEEARKRAGECLGGRIVEATYEHEGELWPYRYEVPTLETAAIVVDKHKTDTAGATIKFLIELMLRTIKEAPFEITREEINKLNPMIFDQIGSELAKYVTASTVAKKS